MKTKNEKIPKGNANGSTVVVAFVSFQEETSRQAARIAGQVLGAKRVEIHRIKARVSGGFELNLLEAEGPERRGPPLALVLGDAQDIEAGVEMVRQLAPSTDIERVGLLIDGHLALAENMDDCVRIGDELNASLRRAQSEARHRSANELFVSRLMKTAASPSC